MSPEDILKEFPFGAKAADPTNGMTYSIVSLEKIDDDTLGGYVSPNKEIYLNTKLVATKGDGIIIATVGSSPRKLLLTPLSKADGAYALSAAQED